MFPLSPEFSQPINQDFNDGYGMGYNASRTLLKYPSEIISFIDSCGFDAEQLQRIIRGIEELTPSESDDSEDESDSLREYNGEYDKI